MPDTNNILWFKDCSYKNKELVGGKCSSLGELYKLSEPLLEKEPGIPLWSLKKALKRNLQ